jgi:hypothetical protein
MVWQKGATMKNSSTIKRNAVISAVGLVLRLATGAAFARHELIFNRGIISHYAKYVPDGTPVAHSQRAVTIINQANLADLGGFAWVVGWKVMWVLTSARIPKKKRSRKRRQCWEAASNPFKSATKWKICATGLNHIMPPTLITNRASGLCWRALRFRVLIRSGDWRYVTNFVATESRDMKASDHA